MCCEPNPSASVLPPVAVCSVYVLCVESVNQGFPLQTHIHTNTHYFVGNLHKWMTKWVYKVSKWECTYTSLLVTRGYLGFRTWSITASSAICRPWVRAASSTSVYLRSAFAGLTAGTVGTPPTPACPPAVYWKLSKWQIYIACRTVALSWAS